MKIDKGGGGGEAGRGRSELGPLLEAIKSTKVLEKRIPLIKQLEGSSPFTEDDLGLILESLVASWTDSTCSGVPHCTLHKSILQVALKCLDLDITEYLWQFLTLGAKASSWCGKHLQWSIRSIDEFEVAQEEEHKRLRLEINWLSFNISTKLHGMAAKCITVLRLEVAAGEWGQEAGEERLLSKVDDALLPTMDTIAAAGEERLLSKADDTLPTMNTIAAAGEERLLSKADDALPTMKTIAAVGPRTKGLAMAPCSLAPVLSPAPPPQEASRRCAHCASEKTPQWRRGPDGPRTLCNACGTVFMKEGRLLPEYKPLNSPTFSPLLHSNKKRRPSKETSAAGCATGNDVAALFEVLPPCSGAFSLDAFFDHTGLEVSPEEAGQRAEEVLEWLSNKEAFPSVETMAVEEASALDAVRTTTNGRRRVKAMETTHDAVQRPTSDATSANMRSSTSPQADVQLQGDFRAENETAMSSVPPALPQRRCAHCSTQDTHRWQKGPEGHHTLCNACGMVFWRTGRLLPGYRPASSPAFSPQLHLHSNRDNHALKIHRVLEERRQSEADATASAAGHATAEACRGEARHESMEVKQLPVERPPADRPAFSFVLRDRSHHRVLGSRRKSEEEAFAAIRATAKAGRADRAAARRAAMDN